jgi:hypothetical protein
MRSSYSIGGVGVEVTAMLAEALKDARTQDGTSLAAISERAPLLLIFLRHFG